MQRPSKYEMLHAMRYAHEQSKMHMMHSYRQMYPELFQHAQMDVRPATKNDYYIPPTLASQCIVVNKTYFTRDGCDKVSCFPFRSDGFPCAPSDQMHWTRVGSSHILSCQPSCQASKVTVDAEWRNQTCVQVNPYTKYMAMFPEVVLGVKTKNPLHLGLDWKDGKLYLNATYCKAYGLDFDGKECIAAWDQTILEMLLGTTVYRSIKLQGVQPPAIPPPPPMPNLSAGIFDIPVDEADFNFDHSEWVKAVVSEFAFDFGLDIAMDVVAKILKKRAPRLLMTAAKSIPIKAALAQMVMKQTVSLGVKSLITAGKIVGVVDGAFTLYSIITGVLDIYDPLRFGNLLTMKQVELISKRLDLMYFEREDDFSPELTPEFVWDFILVKEDLSDDIEYFGSKINEYLSALRVGNDELTEEPEPMFDFNYHRENKYWNWSLHIVVMLMLVILAILYVEWVHLWACVVLFAVIFLKDSSDEVF